MIPRRTDAAARARRFAMIVRRCHTLSKSAILVAEFLHRLELKHDRVFPSRAVIARAIGRCERSVSRAVGELEAAALVDVCRDRPHARKDGSWTRARTNLYRLKWPPRDPPPARKPRSLRCDMEVPSMTRSESVDPGRRRHLAASPSSSRARQRLFEPDPDPSEDRRPPKPTAPPWVAEGITRDEWIRRQQERRT